MKHAFALAALMSLAACQTPAADLAAPAETTASAAPEPTPAAVAEPAEAPSLLPHERFTLENGLEVIFHIDRSDPVVAVSLTAHVGSAREKPGRTGFAHLFEHLLFLESENLGKGGLDKLSARVGGSGANGSTNRDRTNYFQTVPNDALEKMLWAEADKLGWFINTVTEPVLAKEKQVVKNEKRQSVDNQPYGHTFSVLHSNLYPEDHPYHWEVIGSLEDLDAAELADVKAFFRDWYTPNNVTLTVAGDFDPAEAKAWVEKYFAEIPRGPAIEPIDPPAVSLDETKSLFHEDNFAAQPQLTLLWPAAPSYHPDAYALTVLAQLLSDGKTAPLNEVLIDEKQLTANVGAFNYTSELEGEFILQVTAFEGLDLDVVRAALQEGFARFEAEGIPADRLERVKIGQELDFYNGLQSVLGKNISLANYAVFAGDPGYIDEDLARLQAVTADDVMRVYQTYVKDQSFVATSFVPKGAPELALDGAVRAEVVEEDIVQGAERTFDPSQLADYERTPSTFDRRVEPPSGPTPVIPAPDIWEAETPEGLRMFGIEDAELPLVRFELAIDGGRLLESPATAGAANLTAEMLTRGTEAMTAAEFDEALAALGAELTARATREAVVIEGRALARNFDEVSALLQDMVLRPRFDPVEFDLAKAEARDALQAAQVDPGEIAEQVFTYALFGADSALSRNAVGSDTSLDALDLEDVRAFYADTLSPGLATFRVVGDVAKGEAAAAMRALSAAWPVRSVDIPAPAAPQAPDAAKILFYDVPGAKQSMLYIGAPSLKRDAPDFFPATVMNYRLGGGGFAARLTQELRETKGYTYGIFSGFDATTRFGEFFVQSPVRSNVTLEALQSVVDIMTDYAATFTSSDLDVTQSFFTKSRARSFESYAAKLGVLRDISAYGLPYDYVAREIETVKGLEVADIQALAESEVTPGAFYYVVVGDAQTQLPRLAELGFGDPVLVNDQIDALND